MVNYLNHYRGISTERYHGHGISFSPYVNDCIAVAGAENFGIKGSGSIIIFNVSLPNPFQQIFNYSDAIFDLSWSRVSPDVILSGSGDGCIQFWVTSKPHQIPIICKKLHHKEVSSVEFSLSDAEYFCSSSWDSTIALSTANSPNPATILRIEENVIIYEARWSPVRDRTLASVSGNGNTVIWAPFSSNQPALVLGNIGAEILSCDWSPADPNLLVTGCTRAMIYLWDLRSPRYPVVEMRGHENAVRKVRFNPIIKDEIASVSYDFTTRLWNAMSGYEISATLTHKEFVYGLDFSLLNPGIVADCSWDRTVQIYKIGPRQDQSFFLHAATSEQQRAVETIQPRPIPPIPLEAVEQAGSPFVHSYLPIATPLSVPRSPEFNIVQYTKPLPTLPEK